MIKKANIAYKYRIFPDENQEILFAKTFGCCRKIWNLMLGDINKAYKDEHKKLKPTPAQYKKQFPYLKEVDSLALANVQMNLNKTFSDFFKFRKVGKFRGYPKFKSRRKSRRSYTTNNQNGTVALGGNFIRLPKVGEVKAVIHRIPDDSWLLKSATVSHERDGSYYCSVLFEYESNVTPVALNSDNVIALDYKSDGLYVDDKGNCPDNHKFYRESARKLAKAQKKLSRKVGSKKKETKSKNYLKQLEKVNKIHRHIANQRNDFLHKQSDAITKRYDVICVETLNMRAISNKKFHNGKATMDNGYGMFLNMLEYKAANRGKYFVKVSWNYPSSQTCHNCGEIHPEMKDLSKREISCKCGYHNDRDVNAALNIKSEGLRILGLA